MQNNKTPKFDFGGLRPSINPFMNETRASHINNDRSHSIGAMSYKLHKISRNHKATIIIK